MGRDLAEASAILALCRQKSLVAAVNFQLRFSPMMLAVADALSRGWLGRLVDVEVHLNLVTPWHLFPFLKGMPRVEIAVHSIHYLDTLRAMLGNPVGVHARTLGHPLTDLAQTRTSAIFDYAPDQRVTLSINHNHDFGRKFQDASFRFECTEGAALVTPVVAEVATTDQPARHPVPVLVGDDVADQRGGGMDEGSRVDDRADALF